MLKLRSAGEFTYQGQLKNGGVPAGGYHDFIFRLYDADTGGAQVGSDVVVASLLVNDGLFTAELDFGSGVFTGDALWLQVSVRDSDVGGAYSDLSPRQPLNAAPYALYALDGPGSSGFWAASGNNIYNSNSGFVGIGTTDPLCELEVADYTPGDGATSAVTADDAGGAVAAYSSTLGFPFEHYAGRVSLFSNAMTMGLDLRADALDSDIRFYAGGFAAANERMRITESGRVGIGTSDPSATLEVVRAVGASADFAISGSHPDGIGVRGSSDDGFGVFGAGGGVGGIGVYGFAGGADSMGVFGVSLGEDGYAGYFNGRGCFMGDLGVNVQDPVATLDVLSFSEQTAVRGVTSGTGVYGLHDSTTGTFPGVWGATDSLASGASGVRGFVNSTSPGSASTGVRGHNNSTTTNGYGVHGSHDGNGTGVYGVCNNGYGVFGGSTHGTGVHGSSTYGYAGRFEGTVQINGTAEVDVLQINGADLAEKFPVSEDVEAGVVVEIDPDNPGQLRVARGAYNRRVAGVASGAGDIPAGAILGNLPGSEDAPAIALSGRVWVRCDTAHAAIEVGDMLTTSNTPGQAMAVRNFSRAHGAVIGKAMTPLAQGEAGLVLVLVDLQ